MTMTVTDMRRFVEHGEVTAILLDDNEEVRLSNGVGYEYDISRYTQPDRLCDVMCGTFGWDSSELYDAMRCLEMISEQCYTYDLIP